MNRKNDVLLFIVIVLSVVVMSAGIFFASDFISGLRTSLIIEAAIWCPEVFYIFYRNKFKVAVKKERPACIDFWCRINGFMCIWQTEEGKKHTFSSSGMYNITSYRKKKYFAMPVL